MLVGLHDEQYGPYAKLRPLNPKAVALGKGFWSRTRDMNRTVSLRHGYEQLVKAGNFHNLRLAAGRQIGEYRGKVFMDSDVYKWLEAAAYELARNPDGELESHVFDTISLIENAQLPSGYIDSYFQVAAPDRQWADLTKGHEMYCAGHLIEAAIAFNRILGEDRLLKVAVRFADHIESIFGPGRRPAVPGHAEIELALVELYRETGERKYLDLALVLIEYRGHDVLDPGLHGGHGGAAVYQDHVTIIEAATVEGHAVRQVYLTTGVADAYLETGDPKLWAYLQRLWGDMTWRKTFVTGGVGSAHSQEAFGEPYDLPNARAYSETCAAIGSMMWNWRMTLATGEAKYADSFERAMYNAFLSGVSESGDRFFYVNPLLSYGVDPTITRKRIERMEWPWTPCCPPNVMRLLAMLEHYVATTDTGGVQIHQYIASDIRFRHGSGQERQLSIETGYPWTGSVTIRVDASDDAPWNLSMRIPAWCPSARLNVNGVDQTAVGAESGYLTVSRRWNSNDVVVLTLSMEPMLYEAHPMVDSDRGSVAIQRGPLVYCLEQPDQEKDVDVLHTEVDGSVTLISTWQPTLLGGIVTVEAAGYVTDDSQWQEALYRRVEEGPKPSRRGAKLTAIPYFAWANRGPSAMRVWIPKAGAY
jgi:uncharacterized protein